MGVLGSSGCRVLAEVDRDALIFVVEHGDKLEPRAERFEVLAQCRDANSAASANGARSSSHPDPVSPWLSGATARQSPASSKRSKCCSPTSRGGGATVRRHGVKAGATSTTPVLSTSTRSSPSTASQRSQPSQRSGAPTRALADAQSTTQVQGKRRATFESLGWDDALVAYRPILSYNELGSILDEGPSKHRAVYATH